ncbi:GGDEF domain-containing protein [Micromonospora echinofusca]|uniref:GGDEF domain-containing protein n=1 Tax=Micromonospora echinofusca TaxID=47858 RepID=UPI0033CF9C4A
MLSVIESTAGVEFRREAAILVVSDAGDAASELVRVLTGSRPESVRTATFAQASAMVDWASIALVIMLPATHKESYPLIEQLHANWLTSTIPTIIISGSASGVEIIENLAMGFDLALPASTDAHVVVHYANSLLRRRESLVEQSPLTGMPGPSAFQAMIERDISERKSIAICRVDIDRLKSVVDRYGFARGSDVILTLSKSLEVAAARTNPKPFIAHIGGDDFLVRCKPRTVRKLVNKFSIVFERLSDGLYDPVDLSRGYVELHNRRQELYRAALVTLSTGVVVSNQRRKARYRDLIRTANEMLAVAKSQPGSYVAIKRNPT